MALASPGVEVTITDQSQYLPGAGPSVPFVLIATAANKKNPNGAGLAQGTVPANAGKLYQVTSQRDLTTLYGNPTFYTSSDGTPIQGDELNEYGLLAAYSVLGATTNLYVLRADIDLASLTGQSGRPVGAPADGTYWLDLTNSTWGIYVWNATTQTFKYKTPIIISSTTQLSGGAPLQSIGSAGDFAIVEVAATSNNPLVAGKTFWQKTSSNVWVAVGSGPWLNSIPTVTGTNSNPVLPIGANLDFELYNGAVFSVTTTAATVSSLAGTINAVAVTGISAAKNSSGQLDLFSRQTYNQEDTNPPNWLEIKGTSNAGLLTALGLTAGIYYQPQFFYGTNAQQPTWQAGQTYPAPTGSVWVRLGTTNNGLNPIVKSYNATSGTWTTRNVSLATSDWVATEALDATGGKAIPAGTVYGQYDYDDGYVNSPFYLWRRAATGPTVVTGINSSPSFKNGPYTAHVHVSTPGNTTLSGPYTISLADNTGATDFVTAWSAAGIPYTAAAVNSDGAIVLTHTEGGEIVLDDYINNVSSGLFKEAGFMQYTGAASTTVPDGSLIVGTFYTISFVGTSDFTLVGAPNNNVGTTFIATGAGDNTASGKVSTGAGTKFVKPGPTATATINCSTVTQTGSGSGCQVTITTENGRVDVDSSVFPAAGTGYAVGDLINVLGTSIGGTVPTNNVPLKVLAVGAGGAVTNIAITGGATAPTAYTTQLSNWAFVDYIPNEGAPTLPPADFTNWYWSVSNQVDIMVNTGVEDPATMSTWKGYRNVAFDNFGFPKPSGANTTDPNGPIISASKPTTQSDGTTPLSYGDLWIDTSAAALESFPVISRWQQLKKPDGSPSNEDGWVLLDTNDQTSSTGVLFADARWATNGSTNPANDPIPTIKSLLTSNYLDLDAPESSNYPVGMLLFNTRRSGYNVKQYRTDYLTPKRFPDMDPPSGPGYPTETAAWVSASGLDSQGKAYMGRKAQRNMIVKSLRVAIDSNQPIRDEDNFFNLIATPNYPELQPNMVVLNSDRGETAFIVGDTPLGLPMQATDITAWANNLVNDTGTGENGLVTRNAYMGLFYPSGIAPEPTAGNLVVVPPSHMMLRTFIRNDTIAYPWLAAAGTTRGVIDNATNIGYLNRFTGEFQPVKPPLGIRNVLYNNQINPLVNFTGLGLLCYGNKGSKATSSALDRINVARLIAYIRWQLTKAARPFVFEPNDALTRQQIAGVIESLMVDLVAKRGIYDYVVQCDEANNTPARIDRNELWVDVAIEPVKAAEFIYIPVRILNTGELAAGG